jgi:predicted glycoside hydrolase/deacetylase ChbG (UPF0249 family)
MSDRLLLVTADDFGIGPETSRGILDLAAAGVVTSTVLLVNSPHAAAAVRAWKDAGRPMELGWHPCLTLDSPVLPPSSVPSLVGPDGRFRPLGALMKRLMFCRVKAAELEAEFRAQLDRFVDLVGHLPVNVNAHHHVHVFGAINRALTAVLAEFVPGAFLRRVVEPFGTLGGVPGARLKRAFLGSLGKRAARRQASLGLAGNDTLIGVTDPHCVHAGDFFVRWVRSARGRFVELGCHPGHPDPTLEGRDDDAAGRRPAEFVRLESAGFLDAVRQAGFRLVTAAEMAAHTSKGTGRITTPALPAFGLGIRGVDSPRRADQ